MSRTVANVTRPKMNKDLIPYWELAHALHWTVTFDGNGHLRWQPPDPEVRYTTTPGTAGHENRSINNSIAKLRRAGLRPVRHPKKKGAAS
jgi:hypothetical protein